MKEFITKLKEHLTSRRDVYAEYIEAETSFGSCCSYDDFNLTKLMTEIDEFAASFNNGHVK